MLNSLQLRRPIQTWLPWTLFSVRLRLSKAGLLRNALFAVAQTLTVTLCLFIAYRQLVADAGLERMGVWSLLIAGSAVVRIGDVSGAGALARFVAMRSRKEEAVSACDTVHTVMLTSLALNAALGLVLWLAAPFALPLALGSSNLTEASALMPFVVTIMVLGALAVAVTSAIDGAQRADQRALVMMASAVIFLVSSLLLVPRLGVVGFGAAQLIQQLSILVLGWWVLRSHIAELGWIPYRWRRDIFAETTGFAVKLNAIGVVGLLFEPLAKFAFNDAGGPSLVALYELASRLIVQVRSLVVAAAVPLTPVFAAQHGGGDPAFRSMLLRTTKIAAVASVGVALVTLICAPIMSLIILNRVSPEMLRMNAALTAGWSLNLLCLAFYFAAQAQGLLRWNFVSHALIAASVLVGVFVLVPIFGAAGLIAGIVAGLILSMLVVLLGNARVLGTTDVVATLRWLLIGAAAAIVIMCSIAGSIISTTP